MKLSRNDINTLLIFFMFFFVAFGDFFRILSLFAGFNLNFISYFFVVSLFFIYIITFEKQKVVLPNYLILYILFIFYVFISFTVNSILYDIYSFYQILAIYFVQVFVPFMLLFIVITSKELFYKCLSLLWRTLILIVLITAALYIFLYYKNDSLLFALFTYLYEHGVIVNPFQTSTADVSLRFSSVFSSAFTLGIFCSFSSIFVYVSIKSLSFRFLLISLLGIVVFITLNRNSYILYLLALLLIFFHSISYSLFKQVVKFALISFFLVIFFIPFIILLFYDPLSSIQNDGSALMKISTLFSRFDSWYTFFSELNTSTFLFGTGSVQGMGDSEFYIDNGIFYLLSQSGVFSVYLFLLFIIFTVHYTVKIKEVGIGSAFLICGLIGSLLNNMYFDPVFILFSLFATFSYENKFKI